MGNVKIPYYVVIKGRGYWSPSKKMKALGFPVVSCGPDGPGAWAVAHQWAERWHRVKSGRDRAPDDARRPNADPDAVFALRVYPRGSLGEAFSRYRRTDEWKTKQPRTREEWDRVWARVDPLFGDVAPSAVTFEHISIVRAAIERDVSRREAHRVIKIWRALWKVAAAMRYCVRDEDPSLGVRNKAAKGRSQTWTEGEAVRLVKTAWRAGYGGLAAALATMWDSQLSPGDVRALTRGQLDQVLAGGRILTERSKTGASVGAALSARSCFVVRAYVEQLGVEIHAEAPLFRTRGHGGGDGRPWAPRPYTKDRFAEDFREVRTLLFGEHEKRQMLDFRRSGAVEAIAGDAEPAKLAHAMGNTLHSSNTLFETYAPANVTSLRDVAAARKKGRSKLRGD